MVRSMLMAAWGPQPPGAPTHPAPNIARWGVIEQEAEEATLPPSHGVGHIKEILHCASREAVT